MPGRQRPRGPLPIDPARRHEKIHTGEKPLMCPEFDIQSLKKTQKNPHRRKDLLCAVNVTRHLRSNMTNYDAANADDEPGAFSKMGSIKMDFNKSNVSFWLTQLEIKMGFCGIGKQHTKIQALTSLLPGDIAEELQP